MDKNLVSQPAAATLHFFSYLLIFSPTEVTPSIFFSSQLSSSSSSQVLISTASFLHKVRYCIDITLKVLEIAYALGLNVSVVVAHEVSVTNFVSGVSPTKIYITEGVRIYFYKIYVLCHLTLQLLSYLSKIPTVRLIVVVGDIDD
ncbi:unnamed protein product [Vicia faba]|uniref:Uncharacterized protein n=1 Tax=Vicia faba TaxID=3906 RepID=A0AAV1B528_VICFA|nr:unnamed protein product [Vicia faba]